MNGKAKSRHLKRRPARPAGRLLAAAALLAFAACFAVEESADELLKRADQLKTANNSAFQALLVELDARAAQLSATQREYVAYLHVWQTGYLGRYEEALAAFQDFLAHVRDPTLQARARISLVNVQVNATHYEEAYATLDDLLATAGRIEDRTARLLSQTVAATLYGDAGQRDLALHYVDQALAYDHGDRATCIALATRAAALARSGELRADDAALRSGLDACMRIGDVLYANVLRAYEAQALIAASRNDDALRLLQSHDAEMLGTHSAAATSLFRALLARCHLLAGDLDTARDVAQSAIDIGIKQAYSKSVADAHQVLYEIARRQGRLQDALDHYEKFATAEKAYRNDVSARTLAYQMVNQQVVDKKHEADVLNERNRVLQLQGEVAAKGAEAERLYVMLLVFSVVSLALWAIRAKRSQMNFQQLARRDGLTGIINRQHFLDEAKSVLQYCSRASRDVSLILIDLDNFKSVNDTHGHVAGDFVLKETVSECQKHMRPIDLFGRIGGEEFAVLLPECTLETAARRAEELRLAIAGMTGAEIRATASFGVTSTHESGYDLRRLLIHADSALYMAKHNGRNRIERYNQDLPATEQPAAAS